MSKQDRTGNRKTRDNAPLRVPYLGYYFVVTDTKETEQNYITGFRNSLPAAVRDHLVIKVSKTKTEKLVSFCKSQVATHPQYAQPWIVLDRDEVVGFNELIADAEKEGINVGWSNPCIEIWFDAYFGTMHSYQNSVACCKGFAGTFERITGREYQKADSEIYTLLNKYGDENKAIEIAETKYKHWQSDRMIKPSEMAPCTTIHELIREIQQKTNKETKG